MNGLVNLVVRQLACHLESWDVNPTPFARHQHVWILSSFADLSASVGVQQLSPPPIFQSSRMARPKMGRPASAARKP